MRAHPPRHRPRARRNAALEPLKITALEPLTPRGAPCADARRGRRQRHARAAPSRGAALGDRAAGVAAPARPRGAPPAPFLCPNQNCPASFSLSLYRARSLSIAVSLSLSLALSLSVSLSLSLSLPACFFLSLYRARALSLSLSLSIARSLARALSLSLSRSLSRSLSLALSLSARARALSLCAPPLFTSWGVARLSWRTAWACAQSSADALALFPSPTAQPLVPPPSSLPYKVDTSRPSLRTNWTRLVVARRRRRPPRCPARARLRAPRVAAAPAPVGGDGGGGGGEGRGAAYLREQRAATGRRRRAGPVGPGGGPVGPGGRAGCRGCAARALGRRGRARGARPGAAGAAEGLGRAESAGRGRRARAGPRRGGGRFGAAVGTYHVAAHGGVSRAVRTREGAEGWRPGVQKGSPRAAPLRQAKAFALTAGALRRHSPSASWPPPASTSCSRCTSSPEGRGVSD